MPILMYHLYVIILCCLFDFAFVEPQIFGYIVIKQLGLW